MESFCYRLRVLFEAMTDKNKISHIFCYGASFQQNRGGEPTDKL